MRLVRADSAITAILLTVIRHRGLRKEHVALARHATRDRVDRKLKARQRSGAAFSCANDDDSTRTLTPLARSMAQISDIAYCAFATAIP